MKIQFKFLLLILLLLICVSVAFVIDQNGNMSILGRLFSQTLTNADKIILTKLRLPRIIAGIVVGAAVSIGAVTLQTLTKNDLAETGILGVNAGSGVIIVIGVFLIGTKVLSPLYAMPLSFVGALIAVFFIFIYTKNQVENRRIKMMLTGVALNIGFNAFILVLSLRLPYEAYREFYVWLLGSVANVTMLHSYIGVPVLVVIGLFIWRYHQELNILETGEAIGINLGIPIDKIQNILFFAVALLAALSVSIGGNILFVGLIASHLAKMLISHNHKYLIPASGIVGAILFVASDLLGKMLLAPRELPVGLVIAAIGVPCFLIFFIREQLSSK